MSLSCALNWYHKKIGAYDKKLWEKSVDQRILRGVCAIPRKTTRIKTELIDVDLVQGSAFAKAKPQHSWVVTTVSGIKRIILLPLYFSWWQLQTNASLSCLFIVLYILQILAFHLYYYAEDKEISDVPVFEVITPVVMILILGVVHSQIVATFTSQKSHRKNIARTKRRRVKSRPVRKLFNYEQDKSSPESASDYKPSNIERSTSSQAIEVAHEDPCLFSKFDAANQGMGEPCCCQKAFKSGQQLRFSDLNDFEQYNENPLSSIQSVQDIEESNISENKNSGILIEGKTDVNKTRKSSGESYNSHYSKDSAYMEYNCPNVESYSSNTSSFYTDNVSESAKAFKSLRQISKDSVFQSSIDKDRENISSGEDYFVAKKPSYTSEQWKNYMIDIQNSCNLPKKSCSKLHYLKTSANLASRRYSDVGPVLKKSKQALLALQEHRHSSDNIYNQKKSVHKISSSVHLLEDMQNEAFVPGESQKKRTKSSLRNIRPLMELPINIKHYSSSYESGENSTSPNTPSKIQTSDLEWPLITNTDCNSDSTGCSSNCSKELSDVTPAENPFASEILERSKKLSSKDSAGSSKISCTIWEGHECKKADLSALDICSAIIQKVDSTHHSTEYLYIGVCFAIALSFLPLMFRLKNGAFINDIPDVTTDVFTLTVPSSEEVVKITDGLIDVMWGKGLR